jgi:hypothetical protein
MAYPDKIEKRQRAIHKFFTERWNEITDVLDYDPHWEKPYSPKIVMSADKYNDINYSMAGIHDDQALKDFAIGRVAKTMDDLGRKFIFVGTRLGLAVMYVVSKDPRGNHIACSFNKAIFTSGLRPPMWSFSDFARIIGNPNGTVKSPTGTVYRNMGEWMELTMKMLNDSAYRPSGIIKVGTEK